MIRLTMKILLLYLLFSEWDIWWVNENSTMVITAVIQTSDLLEMPNKVFNYFYLGNFGEEYDFLSVGFIFPGVQAFYLEPPLNISFPFIKSDNNILYDKSLFPETSFDYEIWINFDDEIESDARVYAENAFVYGVAFTNELGIANYYADLQDIL